MNIAYVGNFEPRHSTETHIARTLDEDLGHSVVRLQENGVDTDTILRRTLDAGADLFLYTRTWGFEGDGLALLAALDAHNVPTASYHLDLYWGIQREQTVPGDPFWRTKYVFTPDGGSDHRFQAADINHFYVRPGVFRQECYDGTPRAEFTTDVGFVGSLLGYHPEWFGYRTQLRTWLEDTYGSSFRHWPGEGPAIRNEDLNDLYASVKVVVGDSLCMGFNHPHYWSDRVYETIGRGGFLIHPFIEGLQEEFKDMETIVFFEFNDWQGLKDRIDHFLANPEHREEIRQAGQAWVRKHATYTDRLQQALDIIGAHEGWQ